MQNRPTHGDHSARGEASQDGFARSDDPKAAQDHNTRPNLADPAENAKNPPTHPARDDGLGQKDGHDNAAERPVPSGDSASESDRTDLQ